MLNGRHSRVITAYSLIGLTVLLPAARGRSSPQRFPAMWNNGRYMATNARRQSGANAPMSQGLEGYAATVRSDAGLLIAGACDG